MISSKRHKATKKAMDFERIFIEWGFIKIAKNINEAGEAGRVHVNPPKGGILI